MATWGHDFKIVKGHTLKEYRKKYGKLYDKGKLFKFKPNEMYAFPYYKRTYWEIKDKKGNIQYYAIPSYRSIKTGIVCFFALAGITTGSVFLTRHLSMPARSFATDSWRQFAEIANQGLDKLKDFYKPNGGTFIITPEDDTQAKVDAKMRTVKVDGHGTFKVRVIGEAHDTLSSDENKTAALTFEFVDIIDDAVAYNQRFPTTAERITDYNKTYMHDYCNNLLPKMLPDDLKNAIQPVKKITTCFDTGNNDFYECSTDEKFFPLSTNEMNFISFAGTAGGGVDGSTYEYYLTHNSSFDYVKYYYDKNFGIRNAIPYWTRTPVRSGEGAANITYGGFEGDSTSFSTSYINGLSPAFCVGVNEHNFANDSWENIATHANQGLKHLKEYYGRNTFIGEIKRVSIQDKSYRVRVIGENHDTIAETDNQKVAALTFQFLDAPVVSSTYDDSSNDYTTSDLRTTCNNLASSLPSIVSSNIKPVLKEVAKQSDNNVTIVKNTEHLFPLSTIETGDTACAAIEGSTYKYYEARYYRQFDESRTVSHRVDATRGLVMPYASWSRSAHLGDGNSAYTLGANMMSSISNDYKNIDGTYCISPAFCLGEDEAQVTFNNDSWTNVIKYANEGLNSLKKAYGLTTFIGQTRTLKYDGQDYNVRVIGEAADTLADEENLASALTFEFTKPTMESIYDAGSNNWENSELRQNCAAALDKIESEVKNAIQPVKKETYTLYIDKGTEVLSDIPRKVTTEKLFPLSEDEITSDFDATEKGGAKYKYYETHYPERMLLPTNKTFVCSNRPSKEPVGGEYKSYWLRSPVLSEAEDNYAFSIEYDSGYYHSYQQGDLVNAFKGVCPAFAIGKTLSFTSDSWDNLINNLNKGGLPYLQSCYSRSDFVGEERDIKFGDKTIRVRVIDQNYDLLAEADNKTATFTFECVEILDNAPWNKTVVENDDYHYLHSTLYQFVTNEDDPNSIISRFKNDNPVIYENLKTVKKVLTDKAILIDDYIFDTTVYETKMFLPHTGEMFMGDLFGFFTKNLGLVTPYYFNYVAGSALGGLSLAAGIPGHRAKNSDYWVATPIAISYSGSDTVDDGIDTDEYVIQSFGVAPMFCL